MKCYGGPCDGMEIDYDGIRPVKFPGYGFQLENGECFNVYHVYGRHKYHYGNGKTESFLRFERTEVFKIDDDEMEPTE